MRRPAWAAPAAILAAAILAYLPALGNGWIWDDPDYVTRNRVLTTPGGLLDIWLRPKSLPQWYPAVHTTYWMEYRLWGLAPLGYHLVNVLLHGAAAALLFRLLRSLAVPGAWIAGMLFALHPVHVESVAWVTERKNTLSAVFAILALLQWVRFSDTRARRAWALSLFFFVLALLSKSVTATLPAAALVIAWWRRGRVAREDALPLLPFFAIGIASGLLTAALERGHVGAEGADWALSPADRVVLAGRALWFYAGKLALPVDLAFIYPRWEVDASRAWQWIFPAATVAALAALLALRHRVGRGPLAAALLFCGTLFPALGFLNVYPFRYSYVADHFQYLASAPLLALLAAGLCRARSRFGPPATALLAALLLSLGALTARQCRDYRDEETLWRATLARNPGAWIAWNNLGVLAQDRGEFDEAERDFRQAVALSPGNYEAWNNLAVRRLARGDHDGALECVRRSLEAMPAFLLAHMTRAEALAAKGDVEGALASYREAVRLKPDFFLARWNLVQTLDQAGRTDDALAACREAVAALPGEAKLRVKLGMLLLVKGDVPEALAILEAAARGEPRLPAGRLALGEALLRSRQRERALEELRQAVALAPTSGKARALLAGLLDGLAGEHAAAGRAREASEVYREVILLEPDRFTALQGLAWVLATAKDDSLRRPDEALALARKVVARIGRRDPWLLDVLAAAEAAGGRFEEAARTCEEAAALEAARENPELLDDLRRHAESYRAGKPLRL